MPISQEWQAGSPVSSDCVQVSNGASQAAPATADDSGAGGEERYTRLPPVNSAGLAKLQVCHSYAQQL